MSRTPAGSNGATSTPPVTAPVTHPVQWNRFEQFYWISRPNYLNVSCAIVRQRSWSVQGRPCEQFCYFGCRHVTSSSIDRDGLFFVVCCAHQFPTFRGGHLPGIAGIDGNLVVNSACCSTWVSLTQYLPQVDDVLRGRSLHPKQNFVENFYWS